MRWPMEGYAGRARKSAAASPSAGQQQAQQQQSACVLEQGASVAHCRKATPSAQLSSTHDPACPARLTCIARLQGHVCAAARAG